MNFKQVKRIFLLAVVAVSMLAQANAQVNYKTREEIPEKYKWNFSDIYENWEA